MALLLLAACSHASSNGDPRIVVHPERGLGSFERQLLGTNVPAWILPTAVSDPGFRSALKASGATVLRLPGGSWSDQYSWLACENGDGDHCLATWGLRPSDFVDLLEDTGRPAIWTVSINATAQESAAAVAFFNGRVDDDRPIGVDRNRKDWLTVGHWAQLRADHGHPQPAGITSWEVGNEVYGAKATAGQECASWGWEDAWTCDGTEYANGTDAHDGYLAIRAAMRSVDPGIAVGAVGVGERGEWSDWDDKVIEAGHGNIDFYVVHHYGSDQDVRPEQVIGLAHSQWPKIIDDVRETAAAHGMADLPIAVTEYNLISFIDADDQRRMITMANAFYLAETIGELAASGVTMANQWNLANGKASNGSDYGLLDATTHQRSPAYYALALWSRLGDERIAVDPGDGHGDLVLYAGRHGDGSVQLLVLNPTKVPVSATIALDPTTAPDTATTAARRTVTADVVMANSLDATDVTYNGSATPSLDLSEPPSVAPTDANDVNHTFPACSITLMRWSPP